MTKSILAILLCCAFFACKEAANKRNNQQAAARNDTFDYYREENNIPLLTGFAVDTIKHCEKATDFTETLICPYIKDENYKAINGILNREIKRKASLTYMEEGPVDTAKEVRGVTNDNVLLQMYKNKNLVSYGFLSESDEPGQMRPFRKYFTVNYDTTLKKFIYFSDYFKFNKAEDSSMLIALIYRDVADPNMQSYTLGNEINFSVNDENVYFYFDMFGETGIPYGLVKQVKKKYLLPFINESYK